jgi:hypothetical protein
MVREKQLLILARLSFLSLVLVVILYFVINIFKKPMKIGVPLFNKIFFCSIKNQPDVFIKKERGGIMSFEGCCFFFLLFIY